MHLGSPLDAIANATSHAAYVALKPEWVFKRDFSRKFTDAERRELARRAATESVHEVYPGEFELRRPTPSDVEIYAMFAQSWGSTALGFGGIGGQAITPAYTVVVAGPSQDCAAYFGGRFAYRVVPGISTNEQLQRFLEAVAARSLVSVAQAAQAYGAVGVWTADSEPIPKPGTNGSGPKKPRP